MSERLDILTVLDDKEAPIPFDRLEESSFAPAVRTLIGRLDKTVEEVTAVENPTWDTVCEALDNTCEDLNYVWSVIAHLNSVVDTPALRAIYNELILPISEAFTRLGQNEALYAQYKKMKAGDEFKKLSATRRRILEKELEGFRLSGADLNAADKARMMEISREAAQLSQKFSENLLDCTNDYALWLPEGTDRLKGIPEDDKKLFAQQAAQDGKPGYKITLHMPNYLAVMQYAEDRALREELYKAHGTRASDFSPAGKDNAPIINRLLELRSEKARLLGYKNFAEVSLVPKMAKSPEQVVEFLRNLASKAKPFAEKDLEELLDYAKNRMGIADPQPWDNAYVSEKLRENKYSFSEQEVRQYFTEPKVLEGLFGVAEKLYGIKIREAKAPVWHKDVRFYEVLNNEGARIASFYTDLYAREGKRGGAWMNDLRSRRLINGRLQTPAAYLICNFAAPVGDQPALLTHSDVETVFHEFGHTLHHMLTSQTDLSVSGISGVEWDAVELPSQFMENFAWNWEVVESLSEHVVTKVPLPRALFDKMLAARNFEAGMSNVRQIEFALFDMLLHSDFDPKKQTFRSLLDDVRKEVAVVIPPSYNRFPESFSHIFAGGYSAGYYSYKWAEVLSADAFSLFEEKGIFNAEVGHKFLAEILSRGGSRDAMENFVAFRGREPRVDALLELYGMLPKSAK
jgi:oligopeptidase A